MTDFDRWADAADDAARTRIDGVHCQACGRVDPAHDQGYTACCNERRVAAYDSPTQRIDCRNGLGCSHD